MSTDAAALRDALFLHVDRLAGLIGPRYLGKPSTIKATIGYIHGQWSGMGYEVRREEYDALGDTATNLIIEQPGRSRAEEIIVLGAHYDTVPSTPGADDNASAVAVMLEVSRLLQGHVGGKTLRCVAFACEEPPYFNVGSMGSQHHAREAAKRRERIAGMLCLEMVGTSGQNRIRNACPIPCRAGRIAFSRRREASWLPWGTCPPDDWPGTSAGGSSEAHDCHCFRSCFPSAFTRSACPTTARFGTRAIPP